MTIREWLIGKLGGVPGEETEKTNNAIDNALKAQRKVLTDKFEKEDSEREKFWQDLTEQLKKEKAAAEAELEGMMNHGVKEAEREQREYDILTAAISTFGEEAQIRKLHEEIGEFIAALNRMMIGQDKLSHVAEKIADVEIMLQQLKIILGVESQVYGQRDYKLTRLEEKLNEMQSR